MFLRKSSGRGMAREGRDIDGHQPRIRRREPRHGNSISPINFDTGRGMVHVEPRPASFKNSILGFNMAKKRRERHVRTGIGVLVLKAEGLEYFYMFFFFFLMLSLISVVISIMIMN